MTSVNVDRGGSKRSAEGQQEEWRASRSPLTQETPLLLLAFSARLLPTSETGLRSCRITSFYLGSGSVPCRLLDMVWKQEPERR